MKLIKKNICFIILFAVAALAVLLRNRTLLAPIVSHPDSQIVFSTGDSVLEQTWQPHVKKVAGINVPYTALSDFEGRVELLIYSDDHSELLLQTSILKEFQKNEEGTLEYAFKAIKVMPGERYRIQLRYAEPISDGALQIASGSNYSGCSIDGSPRGEAAALGIVFQKSSKLFCLFMIFFPFLSFTLLFMTVWNRKWEECIGLSMIITTAVLYAAGLFERLRAGMVLIYILAAVSMFLAICFYHKRKMQVKDLFSPALLVFVVLFGLLLLNCRNARFARVDEFAQWGRAVKDMFYYQSFAKHAGTSVAIPRYPPFASLVEYFFVFANGMFSSELVYLGFQTMMMSVLMILFAGTGKKWQYLLASVAVMAGIPVVFFSDIYNCIYVDPLLAVFAAYILICYFSEKLTCFNLLRILGGLFALTLTKDIGLVIAGLLTVVMIADRLYQFIRQKKFVIKDLLLPCFCSLFVIAVYISWQIYMSIPAKAVVAKAQASEGVQAAGEAGVKEIAFQSTVSASGFTLEKILGLLRHEDGGYRYQTIKNFLIALFDEETYYFGNIGVSYVDMFVLLLLLIGALGCLRFWEERKAEMMGFGVLTFLTGMCYSMVLLLIYLFTFDQGSALLLLSHGRYLGSFAGGVVVALAGLILRQAAERERENKPLSMAVIFLLVSVIVICIPMESLIVKNEDVDITDDHVYGQDEIAEIFRSFSAKGEKVFYLCNESNGDSYWVFTNTVIPVTGPYAQCNIYDSEEAYEKQKDIWMQNGEEIQDRGQIMPCEEWEKKLRNCQYVFIFHPNEVFRESYESFFEEPDTIDDGTFYQVKCTDEKVTLAYIGKTGVKSYK